jgi:hypothetical protein
MATVRENAQDAYDRLKAAVKESGDFWKIGNCFDTLTDYRRQIGSADLEMLGIIRDRYNATVNTKAACWYDDYCWWAIASAKAFDPAYQQIFGSVGNFFQQLARNNWQVADTGKDDQVHLGAPQAFTNKDNELFFEPEPPPVKEYWVTPRFDSGRQSGLHGVWQYDIFCNERAPKYGWKGPAECNDLTNPSCPPDSWAGPYQLTLANTLYFLAAQQIPGVTYQLSDSYGFLRAWLGYDPGNQPGTDHEGQDLSLVIVREEDGTTIALPRERVSTYAKNPDKPEPHDDYPKVEYWIWPQDKGSPDRSWGGDIGLLLQALVGYRAGHPQDPMCNGLIQPLILGYLSHLVTDGAPQPYWPAGDELFWKDDGDYKSGIGVFMRGVLQAFWAGDDLVVPLLKDAPFQKFLKDAKDWADEQLANPALDMFSLFNVLATLTLALALDVT